MADAEVALRARHQLHQALGSGGRLRGCAVPGLDGDDGVHQVGVDAVPLGSRVDDAGEQPFAGLGRSASKPAAATSSRTTKQRKGEHDGMANAHHTTSRTVRLA